MKSHSLLTPEQRTTLLIPLQTGVAKKNVSILVLKKGSINVHITSGVSGTLENVLFIPEVPYNLLSVRHMQEAGLTVLFHPFGVRIKNGERVIFTDKPLKDLFVVTFEINIKNLINLRSQQIARNNDTNYKLWHARLGHMSKQKFLELKNNNMFEDVHLIRKVSPTQDLCEASISGKHVKLRFAK